MADEVPSLLDAWQKHCASATLEQFISVSKMQEHLKSFPDKVVQDGFAGSALGGKDDVQALIAQSMDMHSVTDIPHGDALNVLADETRKLLATQLTHDLANAARGKASCGGKVFRKSLSHVSACGKLLETPCMSEVRDRVLSIVASNLKAAGFQGGHIIMCKRGRGHVQMEYRMFETRGPHGSPQMG